MKKQPLFHVVKRDHAGPQRQILAYVAETERSFIRSRQSEGIAAARARGVQFGRQKMEVPQEFQRYCRLWSQGEITVRQAAKELGMSSSTFYRRCKEEEKFVTKGRECETVPSHSL